MNKTERANLKRLFKKINCESLTITKEENSILLQSIDVGQIQAYNIEIPSDILPIDINNEHENVQTKDIIDYLDGKCDNIPTTEIYHPMRLEILEENFLNQPCITLTKDEIRDFRTVMKALKLLDDYSNTFKIISEKETVFIKIESDLYQKINLNLTLNASYLGENSLKGRYNIERVLNLLDIYQNCEHLTLYMDKDRPLNSFGSIPGLFSFESVLAPVIYDL